MKRKGFFIVAYIIATSTIALAKSKSGYLSDYILTKKDNLIIENAVRASLKDPNSALFGRIAAARQTDGTLKVCGEVNARNSFGGYAGMKPYLAIYNPPLPIALIAGIGSDDSSSAIVIALCKQAFGNF